LRGKREKRQHHEFMLKAEKHVVELLLTSKGYKKIKYGLY